MRLSYLSSSCRVKDSAIHGRGLFASDAIGEGEIVAVKGGAILTSEQWRSSEPSLGSAEIQIADELFIAPVSEDVREGSMIFSNHSCAPNIGIQGQIVFLAMRDILAGEELTHDWATTDDDDYTLKCSCGAKSCRGRITGQDWRRSELQIRYSGWFAWHIQRAIDQLGEQGGGGQPDTR